MEHQKNQGRDANKNRRGGRHRPNPHPPRRARMPLQLPTLLQPAPRLFASLRPARPPQQFIEIVGLCAHIPLSLTNGAKSSLILSRAKCKFVLTFCSLIPSTWAISAEGSSS